eukprot:CAMPEP_0113903088 /NCGR_PEP_ID=MMETSP0780_2-20120614/22276_1 /TAXON_ID=652834 /ORGANISM="Palpitomonas bilix" /LENGTH=217 /DNA_ID=CAMNT_0000896095 /DNA_START=55 /DNA_END=704 /DNA_ORIENTATION=+ /assembly_acc=CAM_ASM_000599
MGALCASLALLLFCLSLSLSTATSLLSLALVSSSTWWRSSGRADLPIPKLPLSPPELALDRLPPLASPPPHPPYTPPPLLLRCLLLLPALSRILPRRGEGEAEKEEAEAEAEAEGDTTGEGSSSRIYRSLSSSPPLFSFLFLPSFPSPFFRTFLRSSGDAAATSTSPISSPILTSSAEKNDLCQCSSMSGSRPPPLLLSLLPLLALILVLSSSLPLS